MNKKGAELTVGTIVIIILALIVLVVLVLGFTGGWGNLWGRFKGFFGGGDSNVDSIVQACRLACTMESKYDYCTMERTVKAETEVFKVKLMNNKPTDEIVKEDTSGVVKAKKGKASCKELAEWYGSLGFESCEGLCPTEETTTNAEGD